MNHCDVLQLSLIAGCFIRYCLQGSRSSRPVVHPVSQKILVNLDHAVNSISTGLGLKQKTVVYLRMRISALGPQLAAWPESEYKSSLVPRSQFFF